jgi:hypothetical protein
LARQQDRAFYSIGYAIAFLLVALPLVEFTLTVWPLRPSLVLWRFGTFGLLTQAMMLPTLGVFVALVVAKHLAQRRAQLALVIVAALVCFVQLAGLGLFLLDSLQARSVAAPEMQLNITATLIRASVASIVYACIWAWMAVASFRGLPALAREQRRTAEPLVHGAARAAR